MTILWNFAFRDFERDGESQFNVLNMKKHPGFLLLDPLFRECGLRHTKKSPSVMSQRALIPPILPNQVLAPPSKNTFFMPPLPPV